MLGYLEEPQLLRGVVLLSAPFTTRSDNDPIMAEWFGCVDRPWEVRGRWSPAALFREKFFGTTSSEGNKGFGVPLLLFVGEYEADEILEGTWEFVGDYRKRFGQLPVLEVLRGHNHVSYGFGLGLDDPEYERVGRRLLGFVEEATGK